MAWIYLAESEDSDSPLNHGLNIESNKETE